MMDLLLSWWGSYLLHSSVLIGGLWAAERAGWLARVGTATQEALWRLALLGGLVSASLPGFAELAASAWTPAPAEVPALLAVQPPTRDTARPTASAPVVVEVPANARPQAQLGTLPLATRLAPVVQDLAVAAVVVWWAVAVCLLVRLATQWWWLWRVVQRLPAWGESRWPALAARVAADLGVPVPVLRHARVGWSSPLMAPGQVLCLPDWCLDLPDDEARAVLGHELAHLRRRDPAWRLLAASLQALLWPQLLNRLALRRLDLLAELACDAAAAAPDGLRLALAQSLLRCAEAFQAQGGRRVPALACGAASTGSPLRVRVRRLLGSDGAMPRERRGLRWGLALGMLGLLLAMPAVVVSHTQGRSLLERLSLHGVADALDLHQLLQAGGAQRVLARYPGGSFSVTLTGQVGFTDAEDDVQTLRGTLKVREREGGLSRELTLTSLADGRIQREYREAGEVRAMDDAARQWWARAIARAAEHLTDPVVRARRLFERGGMDAVLADVARARDDHARRQRVDALVRLGRPLPPAVQDRLMVLVGDIEGGFERREALQALARLPLAEPQQLGWLSAAGGIDGDFERSEALGTLAPQLLSSPAVLAAWREVLSRIRGDFELRSIIATQVAAQPRPAVLAAALQAATDIRNDFEKREALGAVASQLQGDEVELVAAYASAAAGIAGAFERREALHQLLDRPRLNTAGLERVLASAESMGDGFERLQVLLRVVERLGHSQPVDAALVARMRRAGRGLGDHERGQLENALDRLG